MVYHVSALMHCCYQRYVARDILFVVQKKRFREQKVELALGALTTIAHNTPQRLVVVQHQIAKFGRHRKATTIASI